MVTGYYPKTILEAVEIRASHPGALLITGGTDVMVVKATAEHTVFLNGIKETQAVTEDDTTIVIGAGCTYRQLISNDKVPEVLKLAMRKIASPAIRSAGTISGNICNASPAGDTLPILYALNAVVVTAELLDGKVSRRRIPINDFILGIRKTDLKETEIVIAIEIPKKFLAEVSKIYYEKVGAREAEAISKLSFIGMYAQKDGIISDIRIAYGSVGITTVRLPELEAKLVGKTVAEIREKTPEIVDEFMTYIHPIDDQRSTAEYRSTVCRNLLKDFLSA